MVKLAKLTGWRAEIDQYPTYYDAHEDTFSEQWDHREALNRAIQALHLAKKEMEEKEGLLLEAKKVLQCHARQDSKGLRERIVKALKCR
jgi:hypothetical protein